MCVSTGILCENGSYMKQSFNTTILLISSLFNCCAVACCTGTDSSLSTGLTCSHTLFPLLSPFFSPLFIWFCLSLLFFPSVLIYQPLTFSDCAVLCHLCECSVSSKGHCRIFYMPFATNYSLYVECAWYNWSVL